MDIIINLTCREVCIIKSLGWQFFSQLGRFTQAESVRR
jgi:hypothetical protein